jgi:transglutaminase-like putative cysteine protease
VQSPEETLTLRSGRVATRPCFVPGGPPAGLRRTFASGYLIQLAPDQKSLDGPSGPASDFTDLHALAEIYLPGAGWIGFDPTSGLLAGEDMCPSRDAEPASAAPISGAVDVCEVEFSHAMQVTRIAETPRVTRPSSTN